MTTIHQMEYNKVKVVALLEKEDLKGFHTVHLGTGSMLYEWRVTHHLSQTQVAEKAGITQQMYQRFESGQRNLMNSSFRVTCGLLEALGMDIVKFYHGEYVFGEEVYFDEDGNERYVKTGLKIGKDPTEINSDK